MRFNTPIPKNLAFFSLLSFCALIFGTTAATAPALAEPMEKTVAITFDDLPYVDLQSQTPLINEKFAQSAHKKIIHALWRNRVPATGFVNEDKVEALDALGPDLLADWNRGLLELGNHGYSHFDSNDLDIAAIEREVILGEATIAPMAVAAGRKIRFFRFPYNHVGDTEAKRQEIERILAARSYELAASTIDTSDYLFNEAYEKAFAARDKAKMTRIKRAYIEYSQIQIEYYGNLGHRIFGRNIAAIMLLHINRINAAAIGDLIKLFKSQDYRFVSLAEAQSDAAYAKMPAYATKYGPMWAYRWAREKKIAVDGRLEQEPPSWISAYMMEKSE